MSYDQQPVTTQPGAAPISSAPPPMQQQPMGMDTKDPNGPTTQGTTAQMSDQFNKMTTQHNVVGGRDFNHGMFSCFDDIGLCFKTCCCPCITYGEIASKENGDPNSCTTHSLIFCLTLYVGIGCILGAIQRGEVRHKRQINGNFGEDLLWSCCCGCCALIQEHREVDSPLQ